MTGYAIDDCEVLFQREDADGADLRSGIRAYRTKTVKAGEMAYVDCYPVWYTASDARRAREKRDEMRSSPKMEKINWRNAQRRFEQLVNANFGAGDLFVTLTYADDRQPESDARAAKDVRNFVSRLRRLYRRLGLDELRYVYVAEVTESEARGRRIHYHLLVSGGASRDAVEALWERGIVNTRRCQPDAAGLAALANYMTKMKPAQQKFKRKWTGSRNLRKPAATVADHKISRRKVERIAEAMETMGRQVFEKAYPGYQLTEDVTVRASEFVAGAYIRARLRRRKRLE